MTHGADTVHLNEHAGEHSHPDERTYIKIAILLSAITLVEVVIYYLGLPHGLLVALLMAFSAVKFYTVVGMFMHLRFRRPPADLHLPRRPVFWAAQS